jgi:Uma2 family endonuclease
MATTERRRMTLEAFLELPEEKPALELEPDGTVTQKMSPKGKHSATQKALVKLIDAFAEPRRLAQAFPELRAVYGGAAYVPDVSIYRWERIQRDGAGLVADEFTEPQDIAIEIVSPGQHVNALVRRSIWYVDNGVQIALVVDPEDESVLTFRRGQPVRASHGSDAINLADVLPGFELSAEQVFAALRIDP